MDSSEACSPPGLRGKVRLTRTSGVFSGFGWLARREVLLIFLTLEFGFSRSMMDSERKPGGQGDDSVGKVVAM